MKWLLPIILQLVIENPRVDDSVDISDKLIIWIELQKIRNQQLDAKSHEDGVWIEDYLGEHLIELHGLAEGYHVNDVDFSEGAECK